MSNYQKILVAGFVAVALFLGVTWASPAKAQTIEELQAQIAALLEQLSALQGQTGGSTGATTFTRDLYVGVSGSDVTVLQQYLEARGFFVLPASASYGYFGSITEAAVKQWQASVGLPSTGYFGPLSRAEVGGAAGGTTGGGTTGGPCGAGQAFNYLTGQACGGVMPAGCTAGYAFSPITGEACVATGGGTTGGTTGEADGKLVTISVSLESSPPDGTDIASDYNGISLVKWKLRATNDNGVLKQFGIETTNRSWLYWQNAYLYIGDTKVAEMKGLTSASFNEITVGSKYHLTFDNISYTLPVDTDVYITLKVDAISDTGRAAASGLIIQQDTNQIVVLDEDDDYSVSTGSGTGTSNDRTWDWIAAQTGNVVPSGSSTSLGSRWVKISNQTTTDNITFQIFDIKAEAKDAEINSLLIGASTSGDTAANLFDSYDLYEGSCPTDGSTTGCTGPIAGGSVSAVNGDSGYTITFSNLNSQIPKDTKKTFTIKVKMDDDDADSATATLTSAASSTAYAHATWLSGIDKPTYNTLTASGSDVTAGSIHAILYAPTVSNMSMTATQVPQLEYLFDVTAQFSLKANGGTLYVSKVVNTAIATTTTASTTDGGTGASDVIFNTMSANTCQTCGDTSTVYAIPDDGTVRTITFQGTITNLNGSAGVKNLTITKLFFDDDTTGLQEFLYDSDFSEMTGFILNFYMDSVDRSA